jgi:hypothetical protein
MRYDVQTNLEETNMNLRPLAILLTLPLWACSNPGANTALKVVETPIYAAFKTAGCVASGPIMAPAALASAVVPFKDSKNGSGFDYLSNGVSEACNPPWTAQP